MNPSNQPERSSSIRVLLTALLVLFAFFGCYCIEDEPENRPPVADAGADLEGVVGEPIEITGSGTDPDGDELGFRWSLRERPPTSIAELEGDESAVISFTPDVEGVFVLGLRVSDGELESEEDTMQITAIAPEFISGSLVVTVVDFELGQPLAGATVDAGDGLLGVTGADGTAVLTRTGLEGPLTIEVSHPDTMAGPGGETIPSWRGATVHGAVRARMVVPLRASHVPPPAIMGRVAGHAHSSLLDMLPHVGPVIPFSVAPCEVDDFEQNFEDCDPYEMDQVGSGQLRAVVVAPLTDKRPLFMQVSDLLAPPASEDSPLPGNLTSDDGFLASFSGLMGIPPAPDGANGLTWFDLEVPAGRQKILVLGLLITVDTHVLMDLLSRAQSGDPVDPGAILGTMGLQTLMVGVVEVDVPSGGTYLFDTEPYAGEPGGLTPEDLDQIYLIPATLETRHGLEPYAMDPAVQSQKRWVEITFERRGVVLAQGLLEDPRLESHVPDTVAVRVGDGWEWLDVPADTGEPETFVPYALVAAVAETEAGLLPMGLAFTRAGARSIPEAVFGLPRAEGIFAGAPMQALGFTARGVGPYGEGAEYVLLPGQAIARQQLSSDTPAALSSPLPFSSVSVPEDAGLRVGLLLQRPDRTTTEVTGAAAMLIELDEPDPALHVIDELLEFSVTAEAHLAHVVLHRRDPAADADSLPVEIPLWDIYLEPGAELSIEVPTEARDLLTGGQVRIDVTAAEWSSPLDMERWSGERLRSGPRNYTVDTWLAVMP